MRQPDIPGRERTARSPARCPQLAASSASGSASATIWSTREGDSPIAVARARIEIPSARAETSRPRLFPFGLLQPPRGTGDPRQDSPVPPARPGPLADRHPPFVPAAFRKLDAVAVLTGPLLPAPRFQGKFLSNAVRGLAPRGR
ncbi:MAG: hypothetical protein ABSA53_15080 [Streptosporangiaceae bacterium]